jgi:hypothetical protein
VALRDAGLRAVAWTDATLLHDVTALRTRLRHQHPDVLMLDLEPPFEAQLARFRLLHDPLLRGRRVVVTSVSPAALRRDRRRLGIGRVVGLPATVAAIVAVLRRAARAPGPDAPSRTSLPRTRARRSLAARGRRSAGRPTDQDAYIER